MSYQYPYSNQNVNDRDSIFEDVYIYGKFNYDFSGDDMVFNDVTIKGDLTVEGYSLFLGITTFKNLVDIGSTLTVDYLNVNSRFNVGEFGEVLSGINTGPLAVRGRVGVANTAPFHRFQVGGPNTLGTPTVPGGSIEPDSNAFVVTGLTEDIMSS